MRRLASICAAAGLNALSVVANAEPITGDFGLQLGANVDQAMVVGPITDPYIGSFYAVRPPAPEPLFAEYAVALSPQQRIGLIRARSAPMEKTACYRAYRARSKQLQARYADSGYYALDDGDMYYDGTRQAVVVCEVDGDSGRVMVEYVDEAIERIKPAASSP